MSKVKFNFKNGRVKDIGSTFANLLEAKKLGKKVKEVKPPETKEDKIVNKRVKK